MSQDYKTHREDGKRWRLPNRVRIGGDFIFKTYAYEVLGFRPPKKGEFYLSGARIMGYQAPNDLSTPFLVVRPTEEMVPRTVWVPKEES
jgi:hypothetical protein